MGLAGAMRSAERDAGDPLYPLYSYARLSRSPFRIAVRRFA